MLRDADAAFVGTLRDLLPEIAFRADPSAYFTEPRGRWQGKGVVVAPANTDEVARVVTACAAAMVPVVPYGGGTGLVGGQVAPSGPTPVVLSLERMRNIRNVDAIDNVIICDAGVILADIQSAAKEIDRLFPLSLASEGSARIGGLLATNAGGLNVLRYGTARAQCLGLEVVLADGTIWNGLSRLRKDNTGYDLRDLMIGSEGTLGIITAAALRLAPRPTATGTALLAVNTPQAALQLLRVAQSIAGEEISAFELMHRQGFDFLAEVGPVLKHPFASMPTWSVLIEVALFANRNPQSVLEDIFAVGLDHGLVADGVIAQSEAQRDDLWALRENIPEANRRMGSIASHDIALPLGAIPAFIAQAEEALSEIGTFRVNCFGHIGDGNLHYNVFPPVGLKREDFAASRAAIHTAIHDLSHRLGGTFSAEHGVGRLKVADLQKYGDAGKLKMMRAVKQALDPCGILNPGAVFPE